MSTINITNNTDILLNASSADNNATLNRYLKSLVTFKAPPTFDPIINLKVANQRELDFPITLSAAGEGKFALERTTLDIQLGASASIGLLQDDDEADFFTALNMTSDPASAGLISFVVTGTLTADDTATEGDFTFGISSGSTFTLTSFYETAANDTLGDAIKTAVVRLTIPHDIADLKAMPPGAICQLDGSGSLKFSTSFTYNFLNDPLASVALNSLPSFAINASASATLEGAVTHTSDHALTIAKLPNGLLHISVSLMKTDDLETSLTVSAGATAQIGSQDALAFLLNKIDPNAAAEADAIASEMPDAAKFKSDIKAAIDTSLSTAFAASLKGALENSTARNRVFVYEIDILALDQDGTRALTQALTGDFSGITKPGVQLQGIKLLDSALSITATHTQTIAIHLLGLFNAASTHKFIAESTIDFTADTHEIVLSDETLQVKDNNLAAEKLRKVLLKDITLTLAASANTKDVKTPITLAFVDKEGSTSPSKMCQFVNVLNYLSAPDAAAAQALLGRKCAHFGPCGISLSVGLSPDQSRRLFVGPNGAYTWDVYAAQFCSAEKVILTGDDESAYRLPLFNANQEVWNELHDAGAAPNIMAILQRIGMSGVQAQVAVTDVITAIWWADAMAAYSKALTKGQPLESLGKEFVKDSNNGYDEPWMIMAAWNMTGRPPIKTEFVANLPRTAAIASI